MTPGDDVRRQAALASAPLLEGYECSGWQIDARPAGLDIWSAMHRSEDGRHIRYIVAHSPGQLAARLAIADEELDGQLAEADREVPG
jgi:hypothetical protein